MSAADLLAEARRRGVRLFLEGERVIAEGLYDDELLVRLRRHREEIRAVLAGSVEEPAEPCPLCGSGAYYRAERCGPWRCWGCLPPERGPVALLTVPGGHVPAGEPQDAGAVLAEVAAAAGVPVARLKAALSAEDLDDIAAGRIGVRELRVFVEHLLASPEVRP